ncbi:hypothetical protein CDL12_01920 [Handroanthus impetiginosus]|uniref:S-protein homolog n=1 Tax=Handroanthus impetiginosus TaxID=429701 RepID=A0A2G9I6E1_9LAMI|nr:hypothetical protein CDL12_01920 [Handroanthus impetiginosus]
MDTCGTIRIVLLLLLSASLHGREVPAKAPADNRERKFSIWAKTIVRVYNNLGKDIDLNLHCKSKDDDLGVHLLRNGDCFEWKFHPNIIGTTLFYCDMKWQNVTGDFDIYVAQRDEERCLNCVWQVSQDGVRGYNEEGVEQIWFRWVPRPPALDLD